MNFELRLRSVRARKARLRRVVGPAGLVILLILALGSAAATIGVLSTNNGEMTRLSYLNLGIALFLLALAGWYRTELSHLEPTQKPKTLDDILEARLLSRLRNPVTPRSLWQAAVKESEGRFICNHLLVSSEQIGDLLNNETSSMPTIWQATEHLRNQTGSKQIHAGDAVAALILCSPTVLQYLERYKLHEKEIIEVHAWLDRILDYLDQPRPYFGGIGRDWATGFTPMLDEFGINISRGIEQGGGNSHFLAMSDKAELVMHNLSQGNANVALIGSSGTGKTALVQSVAQRLLSGQNHDLRYFQIVSLNAAAILSHDKANLERLVLTILAEAIHARNIILFLDDARLFFGGGTGAFDLSQILLPIMQNHQLKIIAAFTPGDFQRLKATNESLTGGFSVINMSEPELADTYKIVEDFALMLEHRGNVLVPYEGVREAVRLSGQFMQDQAYPGKAIALLDQSLPFAQAKVISEQSVQQAVEKSLGVRVGAAAAPEADILLHLEDRIHERMINQKRAVSVVASALRRGRAGVSNPTRPIGSFLFLGPTGVGKTELARSLAATYFGDERQMIRLDMSEYQQVSDVTRLLSDGADSEQSLLISIRQQPFSVVLMDEVEKAHPNILNLLLQLLDEGQLTDVQGRAASFKNAIIICTSNAGASDINEYVKAGKPLQELERPLIEKLIKEDRFRPELINRFDEVVLFRSLNHDELKEVAKVMLHKLGATLAEQNISVQLTDAALDYIVQAGYDPQFGARPMRRAIQKTVEDVIAKRILEGQAKPGSAITLDVTDLKQMPR